MKSFLRGFSLACLLIASCGLSAQVAVNTSLVTGQMSGSVAQIYRTAYLHFQLVNCGDNLPSMSSQPSIIVQDAFDLRPSAPGNAINGTIVGNDQPNCGGVLSTYYVVTPMKDASHPLRDGIPYVICSATSTLTTCGNASSLGSFDITTAQPMSQPPPAPGFTLLYGNPRQTQTWKQPTGTEGVFVGTFDFTNAILIGVPGFTGNALTIQGLAVAASGNLDKYALTWDAALNQIDWQPTGTNANAAQLQGKNICATSPTLNTQFLGWSITNNCWQPQLVAGFVPSTGGSMTGALTLPGSPTSALQAATKGYVDTAGASKADLVSGRVPTAELGTGSANSTTCLLGNQSWGPCPSGTNILPLNNNWTGTNTLNSGTTFNAPIGINSTNGIYSTTGGICDFEGQPNQDLLLCDLYGIGPVFNNGDGTQTLAYQLAKIQQNGYMAGQFNVWTPANGDFEPPPNTVFDTVGGGLTITPPGVFTTAQMNSYIQSLVGGFTAATEFNFEQPTFKATNGMVGGVLIPSTSNIHQINGLWGGAATGANSSGGTNNNAVGGYFTCRLFASSSSCWGMNSVTQDTAAMTGHTMMGYENDMNLYGSPTYFAGIQSNGTGNTGVMPAAIAPGFFGGNVGSALWDVVTPAYGFDSLSYWRWALGINFRRGTISGTAIQIDGTCLNSSGGPCSSALLTQTGYTAGNVAKTIKYFADASGNFNFTPATGGTYQFLTAGAGVLIPGSTSGATTLVAPATGGGTATLPSGNGTLCYAANCNSPAFVDASTYAGAPDVCLQIKNAEAAQVSLSTSAFQIVMPITYKAYCGTVPQATNAHGDIYFIGAGARARVYMGISIVGLSSGIHIHGTGPTGVTTNAASNVQFVACNPLLHDNTYPANNDGAPCAAYFNSTTNMPQATIHDITPAAGSPSTSTITLNNALSGTPPTTFAGRFLCIGKENATELAANNGAAACYEINAEPTGANKIFVVNSTNLVACPNVCASSTGKAYLDTPMFQYSINTVGNTGFFVSLSDASLDCAYIYGCANFVNGADQEGSYVRNVQLFNATVYGFRLFVGNNVPNGTGAAYNGNAGGGSHSGPYGPIWFNYQSEVCEIHTGGCWGMNNAVSGGAVTQYVDGTLMMGGDPSLMPTTGCPACTNVVLAYSSGAGGVATDPTQRNFIGLISDGIGMGTNTQSLFGVNGVTISCKDVQSTGSHTSMPNILNGIGMFFAGPTQSVIGAHTEYCTTAIEVNGNATLNETMIEDGATPMQGLTIINGDFNNCSNPATGHPTNQWCIDLGAAQGTSNIMNVSFENLSLNPGTRVLQNQLVSNANCINSTDKTLFYHFQQMTLPASGAYLGSDCSSVLNIFPQGIGTPFLVMQGVAPTCTFTSGGGTSPSCTVDTGSTDGAGAIIATTGTGAPALTGTITLTFNVPAGTPAFGTNKPVCEYMPSENGAGQWGSLAQFSDKTPAVASDLFNWTNATGATPAGVALSTSTAYWINYHCFAK